MYFSHLTRKWNTKIYLLNVIENRIILFWTNMETQKVRIRRFAIKMKCCQVNYSVGACFSRVTIVHEHGNFYLLWQYYASQFKFYFSRSSSFQTSNASAAQPKWPWQTKLEKLSWLNEKWSVSCSDTSFQILLKLEQTRTSINKRPIIAAVLLYNIADKLFLKTKCPGYQSLQSIVLFWAAYSELCNFCKFWQLALPACIHSFPACTY